MDPTLASARAGGSPDGTSGRHARTARPATRRRATPGGVMTLANALSPAEVRQAAAVTVGRAEDHGSPLAFMSRGPEHRVAALTLAVLLFLGGLMGSANLFVDGMIREDERWLYGATMALCMLAAVVLAARRRATLAQTFALVVLGNLIYVVVALSVADPLRYATPLMLLFASFVAAWFLDRWQFAVNLVLTPLAILIAMWNSYSDPAGLTIRVVASAGMLDAAALGVFILRRRVQRLLEETQALSVKDPLPGLHNRRYLVEQAAGGGRRARRDGTRVAAMVLDLDHFKRLNDAHGHAAGDAVLSAVARALSATVRPADVLARTGGEELVVLGMVGDGAEAAHLAERLRAAVAGSRTDDGHGGTPSIGGALTPPGHG